MKGQSLRSLYESLGAVGFDKLFTEACKKREIRPEEFSIKELAEACCGRAWANRFDAGTRQVDVMEGDAGEGVDVSAFAHITGQIFFNKILEGWENAERIGESMVTNFPTKLDGERIPWLGHVVSEGEEVHPGMPYPETSFGERYVDTPRTKKFGEILSLTKEAIFFDHTGQMLKGSAELGERLAYKKERQILSTILGLYSVYYLNGNNASTYQLSTDTQTTPNLYTNAQQNTPLVDWTSIQNYYILASQILDPDTSEPIMSKPKELFVMPAMYMTAKRIVSATEIRSTYPGYGAGSPNFPGNVQMISDSPLPDQLTVLSSSIAYQLLISPPADVSSGVISTPSSPLSATQANNVWMIGDFKKAFYWMENWPLQIEQAPVGNLRQFEQDVMLRWKASFRGVAAVVEPRYVHRYRST